MATEFQTNESFAIECDRQDSLNHFREQFIIPKKEDGSSKIYLCGHSLGLQPKTALKELQTELDAWANLGVDGYFHKSDPWYSYPALMREPLARLIGAMPNEVVTMNSLTVNLHLMMVSFYQPTTKRYKIVMESPVFSSDTYAVKTQMAFHGYDSQDGLLIVNPREGEDCVRMKDIEQLIDSRGNEIALVLLNVVNYFNGQRLDLQRITKLSQQKGCRVGFDLAHAIGNVPMNLHDAGVDFAVWCNYKYLNSGPGSIGGAYIHERHLDNLKLQRFAGWWGNDPDTRFMLHLQPDFIPVNNAHGWQISCPSILSLAPLRASLQLFDQAGIKNLRAKSLRLTGYLEFLLQKLLLNKVSMITPTNPDERGNMLSLHIESDPEGMLEKLYQNNVICDFRRPNVIRVAPAPLYNTFHEVWRFCDILKSADSKHS